MVINRDQRFLTMKVISVFYDLIGALQNPHNALLDSTAIKRPANNVNERLEEETTR